MEYIYDIVLNFQKEYIYFYEWNKTDKIINIEKIRLYQISNKDYLNLKYYDCIIDKNLISNKPILVTNGLEVMGLLFNKDGKLLKRSSLLFEEANDILSKIKNKKKTIIKYKKITKRKISHESRISKLKKEYLNNFFKENKLDEYLMKYIYYDITNKEENNLEVIYNKLLDLRKNDPNKLYDTIKNIKKTS